MIPYLDLGRQYATIASDVEAAVLATLRSGHYILHLALLAAGVGPGDEVITVPTTFAATVAAVLYCGATPVLVDIDPDTWTMDAEQCARAVTSRTKVILPVHFQGRLADMTALDQIAFANRLTLIEDAAQAHGARRNGIRAGAFGQMGCFSFYPGKNLGAAGEGGAITTDNPELAARLRALRDWGQYERSIHALRGYNYRMDSIQGAVLDVKLKHLDVWTAARRKVARAYDHGLLPHIPRPVPTSGEDHVYHIYAIASDDRDRMRQELGEMGVATNAHYPLPVHLQPAYAGIANGKGSFPFAEAYAARTLSLPIFPELTEAEIAQVVAAVNALAERSDVASERAFA